MKTISYTEARDHLKDVMDQVDDTCQPVRIARRDGRTSVLMSEVDYNGLQETLYLLGNEANASRLLAARRRASETALSWDEVRRDLDL